MRRVVCQGDAPSIAAASRARPTGRWPGVRLPRARPSAQDAAQPRPPRPHRTQRRWPHLRARDAQRLHGRALPVRVLPECLRPLR